MTKGPTRAPDPFGIALRSGGWAALVARLGEAVADPNALAALQERLSRHGAAVTGQVPDLLLRAPDPEAAVTAWLAEKDLSHWRPQTWGGAATDGWSFETAGWNRARGAEAMDPVEIGQAQLDGGLDALGAPGMPGAIGIESLEAALLAAAVALAWWLHRHHRELLSAQGEAQQTLVQQGLRAVGLAVLSGAGASLVLSLALALIPGGQALLLAGTAVRVSRALPPAGVDPFDLQGRRGLQSCRSSRNAQTMNTNQDSSSEPAVQATERSLE
ncbi:hypothetical protein [Synechococcus sp. CS-1327]|uniref:hypothetical protein n=1 Tax=Synechococcus sp. CS-1327 TaxID=2847977 RepID=UPI00223B3DBE|nr:hypothetical protein [Synechococcus sp. CS-1327]MCT0234612.1 hypothetical protein [Synechococcus sp. CS-1327]